MSSSSGKLSGRQFCCSHFDQRRRKAECYCQPKGSIAFIYLRAFVCVCICISKWKKASNINGKRQILLQRQLVAEVVCNISATTKIDSHCMKAFLFTCVCVGVCVCSLECIPGYVLICKLYVECRLR